MGAVLTQEGALALWRQFFGLSPGIGTPSVRLLGQAHTVVHTDTQAVLASFELIVTGYGAQSVGPLAAWQLAPIAAGAQAASPVFSWMLGGACSVWGYWLVDQWGQYSLWGETLASPEVFGVGGGPLTLTLLPTLTSQP